MKESTIARSTWARLQRSYLVIICGGLAVFAPPAAEAHFLWLTHERDGHSAVAQAFLSETPLPEGPEFLRNIAKATITADGKALAWTKGEETYRLSLPKPMPKMLDGFCDLGVMNRGGAKFRLLYTARLQFAPSPSTQAETGEHLRVRLVARQDRAPVVEVRFRGKPVSRALVKLFPENGDMVERKTDANGQVAEAGVPDRYLGLLAKWVEKAPGVMDGKPYDEVRYYATLTFAAGAADKKSPAKVDAGANRSAPFASLPQAVDSFGGAVLGDWLYVYGGHTGKMHVYHSQTAAKHFRRLNLRDRKTWEELPCGPALQGVTLVSDARYIYRIGGMMPRNSAGEPHDLVSVADFARFDPATKAWTALPPLPEPRSTHDSVIEGGKIYVVGGWNMRGGDASNADFLETALVFDTTRADARWETLATPPFRRRALAVAALNCKIYALGGLTDAGKVVKSVDIYDTSTRKWSRGLDLPGSKLQGFAPSAFSIGGKLYISGVDGQLLHLSDHGERWEIAESLATPRLTHRLLPGIANDLLAVGGSAKGAPIRTIESIPVNLEVQPRSAHR